MRRNHRLLIYTGAGISAPSGLQTFRGAGGLWNTVKIEDVCDAMAWYRNRDGIHQFYNARRVELGHVAPNVGHHLVSELQDRYGATVITSNIDDLHERAREADLVTRGGVVHLHGHLWKMTCTQCREPWEIGYRAWDTTCERCPGCGTRKLVRPDVVFLREPAPAYAILHRCLAELSSQDMLLVIGTSSMIVEIGDHARRSAARTLVCNLEASPELVGSTDDPNFDEAIIAPIETAVSDVLAMARRWIG
jgi:NAD-dependent deacetylase